MNSSPAVVGSLVPDFDMPCTLSPGSDRRQARLSDYRGRWLMLIFYPRDFSLVCPTELLAVSSRIAEFNNQGCEVLGISSDSLESHERWIATPRAQGGLSGLGFPLASDPTGDVCRAYGVYLNMQNVALRGLFIIDPNGVLQYMAVHNLSVGRRTDEMLRVLAALQTGGLCAENWTANQPTLDLASTIGPGTILAHYRIESEVGQGAFATVFRALDTKLNRPVAIKLLRAGSALTARDVLDEARAAAALNHPNVCTIYGVDDSEGVPIIAMEYLLGQSMSRMLAGGPMPMELVMAIAAQVASGMAAAHARGIVHGDLKPANVFVVDGATAKILDFGLARRVSKVDPLETLDLTHGSDMISGTPSYMSPEQASGRPLTADSDVFSLGAMLFEMLTGQRAFPGDNIMQVLTRINNVRPEELAQQVPDPFKTIINQALMFDPRDRQIAMTEIAEMLS